MRERAMSTHRSGNVAPPPTSAASLRAQFGEAASCCASTARRSARASSSLPFLGLGGCRLRLGLHGRKVMDGAGTDARALGVLKLDTLLLQQLPLAVDGWATAPGAIEAANPAVGRDDPVSRHRHLRRAARAGIERVLAHALPDCPRACPGCLCDITVGRHSARRDRANQRKDRLLEWRQRLHRNSSAGWWLTDHCEPFTGFVKVPRCA